MDRVRKAFRYADVEGKEYLTKHQYKVAMTVVFGYCPERWEVKQAFAGTSNPENIISFQRFQNSVKSKIDSTRDLFDLECLFASLDKNFKGYLVSEDFLTAAKEVGLRVSAVILESAFKELDRCKKGFIGMDEFAAMMGVKK